MRKDGVVGWDTRGFDVDVEVEGLRRVSVKDATVGEERGVSSV